ncbi:MAG: carboxyl-terminal processing protease, partial [Myxococcota bacterium]
VDLTTDEVWVLDSEAESWPESAAAADALWRKRITNDILVSELQAERGVARTRDEIVESISKRYARMLKDKMSADSADMLESFLGAFTHNFDPHSAYFKPATDDNFNIDISNSLEGIGARLRVDGDYTVVEDIVAGGPADLDGELQPGDRIVAVGQGGGMPEDVIGMRLDRVVAQIRGDKGTEVRLTVIPVDEPDTTRVVTITRDKVLLSESDAEGELIEKDGHKYGLIEVPSFYIDPNRPLPDGGYYGASADVRRLLGELEAEGMEGLILDFRGNGGGSLSEAIAMAGLFIDSGPIVQIRDRSGDTEVLSDPDRELVYDGPMVVLTDPLSASASEIVAGALQDYGRAVVVGAETTHGKGTVQRVVDLDYFLSQAWGIQARSGGLKLTIQKFYRVSGGSTQNRGVLSDVVLPSYWDGLDIYESDLENALAYDEIEAARFRSVGDVGSAAENLRASSATRIAQSEDFQTLAVDLAERAEGKDRTELSLNIDTRRAELEAATEGEEAEPEGEEEEEEEDAGPDRAADFILQEAAAVLGDWIGLQGG